MPDQSAQGNVTKATQNPKQRANASFDPLLLDCGGWTSS
jgi:hypothetical protein